MKVLVLNSGSSSLKFQLFDFNNGGEVQAKGLVERIGLSSPRLKFKCLKALDGSRYELDETVLAGDHSGAIDVVCKHLMDPEKGVLHDLSELGGLGHRVVHGGERFRGSVIIDNTVIEGIEDCSKLAPLHNPPALLGIRACAGIFEGIPQVAVFDTAFYHTIPPRTYTYAIPYELYEKHRIRKYGFHGTSHMYVSEEAARLLGRDYGDLRTVTCHLGNGCSVTAVDRGKAVDTSMGLTPLGGVMMGTRPGDFDPYVPIYMHRELGMPIDEVDRILNKQSGFKGVCGLADVRDISQRAEQGDEQCALALDMFCYRIKRYVGMYIMVMGGVDAIVFTAGIGENNPGLRARILEGTEFLGVKVDSEKNRNNEPNFAAADSKVATMVIPTDEELVIARETRNLVE